MMLVYSIHQVVGIDHLDVNWVEQQVEQGHMKLLEERLVHPLLWYFDGFMNIEIVIFLGGQKGLIQLHNRLLV